MNELWQDAFNKGLRGYWSHPDPIEVLDGINHETAGSRVKDIPYTIWQISKHMEDWAWALLKKAQGLPLPMQTQWNNYYPEEDAPTEIQWKGHLMALEALPSELEKTLGAFDEEIVAEEWDSVPAPHMLIILLTHTAYHTAQIITLRRLLGKWETKAK